jgi:hypothetical protein
MTKRTWPLEPYEGVRRAISASSLLLALAACGGPARPADAPEQEPRTVEEAQTRIDVATRLIQASTTLAQTAKPQEPATPPAAPPSPKGLGAEPGWGADTDTSARESRMQSPCDTSCRAIASMRRAVAVLCRITGDEDERCTDARRTLAESEQRVAACGCANAGP